MKEFSKILAGLVSLSWGIGLVVGPLPGATEARSTHSERILNPVDRSQTIAAEPAAPFVPDGEVSSDDPVTAFFQCLRDRSAESPASGSENPFEAMQRISSQCMVSAVMIAPDGSIRSDANERLIALVEQLGIQLPHPEAKGEAIVSLQPLADSQVFAVPVTLNGQPKQFLLDTGASNSIISRPIAKALGLAELPLPSEAFQYMMVGDNCDEIDASLVTLPPLFLAAANVRGLNSMGLPQTAIPQEMAGVLGLDFLSGFDLSIDPQAKELKLLPPSKPVENTIPLKGKLGVMTAEVFINGKGPFPFLLDTGADFVVLSEKFARDLSVSLNTATPIQVQGFCGLEDAQQVQLAEVKVGDRAIADLDAVVIDSEVLAVLGVEGIIGQNFLNHYQQHWRFGPRNVLGYPEAGSLSLTPISLTEGGAED